MGYAKTALIIGVLASAGCAVKKDWVVSGGSRADATIKLSYEYSAFVVPQVDEAQAIERASERCKLWGYERAEPFGAVTRTCSAPGFSGGCNRWLVTKEYQCVGQGDGASD